MTDFGQRALRYVQHVIAETGLNPSSLAKASGISASTLNRPLRNPSAVGALSMTTIGKISDATGIDPAPFVSTKTEEDRPFDIYSGSSIASARRARKFTQGQVADAVGCHWMTICKIERGEIKITLEWLHRLAPVLGLTAPAVLPTAKVDTADLLAFLHYIRAEHGIDVPERHFEMLRAFNFPAPSKSEALK